MSCCVSTVNLHDLSLGCQKDRGLRLQLGRVKWTWAGEKKEAEHSLSVRKVEKREQSGGMSCLVMFKLLELEFRAVYGIITGEPRVLMQPMSKQDNGQLDINEISRRKG